MVSSRWLRAFWPVLLVISVAVVQGACGSSDPVGTNSVILAPDMGTDQGAPPCADPPCEEPPACTDYCDSGSGTATEGSLTFPDTGQGSGHDTRPAVDSKGGVTPDAPVTIPDAAIVTPDSSGGTKLDSSGGGSPDAAVGPKHDGSGCHKHDAKVWPKPDSSGCHKHDAKVWPKPDSSGCHKHDAKVWPKPDASPKHHEGGCSHKHDAGWNPFVVLCHIPPGNPKAANTISVSPAAVPAHLAHGDYLGPCK
jgi:hypothetical protein